MRARRRMQDRPPSGVRVSGMTFQVFDVSLYPVDVPYNVVDLSLIYHHADGCIAALTPHHVQRATITGERLL